MKKTFLIFLAVSGILAAASCNKGSDAPAASSDRPVNVTVSIYGSHASKATSVSYSNESKVNSLQVFVFKDGDCEAYRSVTSSMQALIPATGGERTVVAVVNAPDLSSVTTLAGLNAASTALADNGIDNFVMTGSVTQELIDGGNVPIEVKRLVSRISLEKITVSLRGYREDYSLKVKGMYLINVPGNNSLDLTAGPTAWVNKLAHADASYDALLYDAITGVTVVNNVYEKEGVEIEHEADAWVPNSHTLADGVSLKTDNAYIAEHVFYSYPNSLPVAGDAPVYDESWSPRGTILVIEATMADGAGNDVVLGNGTTVGYYPVILPALERNKTYTVEEVFIKRLPGTDPFKPIDTGETQVTISVNDWELGLNLGTVII